MDQKLIEPLLTENPNRFVMFPIQDKQVWDIYKKHIFPQKSYFSLYGTWEGVVVGKILPQGVGTISTPGKLNSEKFKF